ncbi:MAG: hypothetical protein K6F99_02320 [Lachnospiraceae bacterium]|nr:hypothetical protein [Lachnospiraceae bacterium]
MVNIIFISEAEESSTFLLKSRFKDNYMNVINCGFDVNELSSKKHRADLFFLYIEFMADVPENFLIYLRDTCLDEEKYMVLFGYEMDLKRVSKYIPKMLISGVFLKDDGIENVVNGTKKILNSFDKTNLVIIDNDVSYVSKVRILLKDFFNITIIEGDLNELKTALMSNPEYIILNSGMRVSLAQGHLIMQALYDYMNYSMSILGIRSDLGMGYEEMLGINSAMSIPPGASPEMLADAIKEYL